MTLCKFSNPAANLEQIRQEIERLTQEHVESLRRATYGGMTPVETRAYDERRKKINELTEQLRLLQETK